MSTRPNTELETFPNPREGRDYTIRMEIPEFTCVCPKTGQPDFATFTLEYVPAAKCVELKSLKLYMWSFREVGAFHEDVTNRILDELVRVTAPKFMRLSAEVERARRHLHHGGRRASRPGLDRGRGTGRPALGTFFKHCQRPDGRVYRPSENGAPLPRPEVSPG